jgi:hypothetical protein
LRCVREIQALSARLAEFREKFVAQQKLICCCLLLLVVSASAASQIPVSVPVNFNNERHVEFSVTIDRHRIYYLDLGLGYAGAAERKLVRQVIGDATNICAALKECGAVSIFDVTISSGQTVILRERRQVYGHYRYTERHFFRNILKAPLRPGTYSVAIDAVEVDSQIQLAKTEFVLRTDVRLKDLRD